MLIAWMLFIFSMSAMDGTNSERLSFGVSEKVIAVTVPNYQTLPEAQQEKILDTTNFAVRKTRHVSEYALLGVLALLVLLNYKKIILSQALISLAICALYAASDEFHQTFTLGRSPLFTDTLIDIGGSAAGILILLIFAVRKQQRTETGIQHSTV
jgi:Predicted integral membrane protein